MREEKEPMLAEFALHEHIRSVNSMLPSTVEIPPGDDLASLRLEGSRILAGVDQVVLGRHCRADTPPEAIGRKAVLRALSDVAAMAATPVATLAAATLPRGVHRSWGVALYEGLRSTAAEFAAPLVGGDLALFQDDASSAVVSVTVLARPALRNDRLITRSGARPGDLVAVTGELGGTLQEDGGGRHLDFPPRINEAIALAESLGEDLVAMLDISDGVASDAQRIIEAAEVPIRCVLQAAWVPARDGVSWQQALSGGEDHELLFCTRSQPPASIGGIPISVIGRVEAASASTPSLVAIEKDAVHDLAGQGWEHAPGR